MKGIAILTSIITDPYVSLINPEEFLDLRKQCYYNLALINKDLKNWFESLYYFHQFYILNPTNKTVVTELANISQKVGFFEESLFFWQQAESMEDGFSGRNRDIWTKIGEVYFFKGDLKMCQFWFGRVAGVVKNSASTFGGMGFGGVPLSG